MKKNIKFGNWENNEADVENGIMTLRFSTNYGFVLENGHLVTTIENKKYKMCYIGSDPESYLKYEIKPNLRDDVSYKMFSKTVEAVGENWRTNAAVLTLIDGIEYRYLEKDTVEYGYNDIKHCNKPLIGLIPVDHKFEQVTTTTWNDYTSEYDMFTTKKAIPA